MTPRGGSRAVLGLLLAATLAGAASFDHRRWPAWVGDEATYVMQAESLAFDLDLRYERADYDRFVARWGRPPDGLILDSPDGGRTLRYSKPAAYAAAIAPFIRISPEHGAPFANALFLALAAWLATRTLERRLGPTAALWVAVWIFASVAFANVFWVHADLFLACAAAAALALVYLPPRPDEIESRRRFALRWLAAGALLALVATSRPFYAALLLPAALAVPRGRRRLGGAALAGGALALALAVGGFELAASGAWTPYEAERQSFDSATGFPDVQWPATEFPRQIAARGSNSWRPQATFEPRQSAWNALYFFVGRHVGVLPYYLPLLLGLAALRPGEGRRALLVAVLLAAAGFAWLRPFNFYGGGGALANRYFLPLYPALWFCAARRARLSWALAATLLAAPFMSPLWRAPRAFLLAPAGGYAYVSDLARHLLPYETTLSHLKPAGQDDLVHHAVWVKLLTPGMRAEANGETLVAGRGEGELLLATPAPIGMLTLDLGAPVPAGLAVVGAALGERVERPDRSVALALRPRLRARHRMWWTDEPWYLYDLRLAWPGPDELRFALTPAASPLVGPAEP